VAAKRARRHRHTDDTEGTAGERARGGPVQDEADEADEDVSSRGEPTVDEPQVGVTLLVDDDSLGDLDDVLRRASKAGLRDGQVLPAVGVITGTAHPDTLHELSQVPGIRAAEADRTIQLPPPDQPQ
jgi:hypothetical protein